ncbi:MAG: hypothetical protein ABW000_20160 [Actinoplanes sp.]
MQKLSEQTLAAIGRMTVAATDLEYLLAWTADAPAAFAQPGGSLAVARASARSAAGPDPEQVVAAVEAAGTQLALSQVALRRLWRDDSPADPGVFDQITAQLVGLHTWLQDRVPTRND